MLCDALERVYRGEIRFLLIEMPPRHSKSLHVSQLFPAWVFGKNPDDSIIVSSYSSDLATDHGRETRNLMEGQAYQNVFATKLAADSTAKGKFHTEGKGAYNAAGVGGSITGKGAKFFIIDDPFKDRKEADSTIIRDDRWRWLKAVARTRLTPDGAMIIMHTRWHDDDIIGRTLRENEWVSFFDFLNGARAKYVRLKLPAIAEDDEPYRKRGEALWPTHYDLTELEDIRKDLGGYEWSALYQQNPIDEGNRIFKREWFKTRPTTDLEHINTRAFLTIDTKSSDGQNAGTDYIGTCLNFVDQENNWHFMATRHKLSTKQLVDLMFNWYERYKLDKIGIEKTAFTEGLKPYIDEEMRRRNMFLPIVELSHRQTRKEQRIEQSLSPRYERGAIYHLTVSNQNQCADLEEELLRFPKAVNDDVSDAAAYQSELAEPVIAHRTEPLRIY